MSEVLSYGQSVEERPARANEVHSEPALKKPTSLGDAITWAKSLFVANTADSTPRAETHRGSITSEVVPAAALVPKSEVYGRLSEAYGTVRSYETTRRQLEALDATNHATFLQTERRLEVIHQRLTQASGNAMVKWIAGTEFGRSLSNLFTPHKTGIGWFGKHVGSEKMLGSSDNAVRAAKAIERIESLVARQEAFLNAEQNQLELVHNELLADNALRAHAKVNNYITDTSTCELTPSAYTRMLQDRVVRAHFSQRAIRFLPLSFHTAEDLERTKVRLLTEVLSSFTKVDPMITAQRLDHAYSEPELRLSDYARPEDRV